MVRSTPAARCCFVRVAGRETNQRHVKIGVLFQQNAPPEERSASKQTALKKRAGYVAEQTPQRPQRLLNAAVWFAPARPSRINRHNAYVRCAAVFCSNEAAASRCVSVASNGQRHGKGDGRPLRELAGSLFAGMLRAW